MSVNRKIYFPKRMPEPKIMARAEFDEFEKASEDSYKRWMVPLADDALKMVSGKTIKVLDVACGPGLLTKEFGSRSKNIFVIGVDNSKYALRLARKNCRRMENISFRFGSVERLPFHDGYFDLVVCKDSFHHFNDPRRALTEMMRVVKPGGIFYMQDLRRDVPRYLLKTVMPRRTVFMKLLYYSTRAAYTKEEIKRMLKNLKISKFAIKTRKIDKALAKKYQKMNISLSLLRSAFQSRYVLIVPNK